MLLFSVWLDGTGVVVVASPYASGAVARGALYITI